MDNRGLKDRYVADYHTHTTYSHGKGSVRDNVEQAIRLGLKEIAITDHGRNHFIYGVSDKNLVRQLDEIDRIRDEYKEIRILAGVESNLTGLSGKIDISKEILSRLDILLCGFHKPVWSDKIRDYFRLYYNAYSHYLYRPTKSQVARNTRAYIAAIKANPIDIVTHPNYHLQLNISEIVKVCEDYQTAFELSTRHDDLSEHEQEILASSSCYIAINSDAHKVEKIADCGAALSVIDSFKIDTKRIINLSDCQGFKFKSKQ